MRPSLPEPAWLKFARTVYGSYLILLLFSSATVSLLLGNLEDAVSIAVAIVIGVPIGSTRALRNRVAGVTVFARTTPSQKTRAVSAFQSRGEFVAMTGDGVNDAPALKVADIGVSMGRSGMDVAKEAADVIRVDDRFGTILSAVEEGKHIFYNNQNLLSFRLSTAVAALTLITLSTMTHLSKPLNPMKILFISILMDGPPSQSLRVDTVDRAVMKRRPRRKGEPIITRRLIERVLFSASIVVFGTLPIYRA
ncbi:High affinity Ca2+/Mn2+ P-type ATPase-like protein [Ceratobasidium sp. 370]|nr:High affinity Ca2+/Mn2+ P-type ATPase-like protein [Ceratobasidium sp. 370]